MSDHGVPIARIINGGGIPQRNEVLNQVYANVLGKPVLVPAGVPTGFGAGIFASLAAGIHRDVAEAQKAICLPFRTYYPQPETRVAYDRLYALFRELYFGFGAGQAMPSSNRILPLLRSISAGEFHPA
jgi:L-ribulokinase